MAYADVDSRVRALVAARGCSIPSHTDTECVRAIAEQVGTTMTMVRETIIAMRGEHRRAHRIQRATLEKQSGATIARLRAVKIALVDATEHFPLEGDPPPGYFVQLTCGAESDLAIFSPGSRAPAIRIPIDDLLALARLARLE